MAFSDFIMDGFKDVHLSGGFEHSAETLQALESSANDEAKAARAARAIEIAGAIGAQFDTAYAVHGQKIAALFAEMQQYWSAPVPFGALPVPPPAELYQRQAAALQQCVDVCQAYDADARKLAEAGAPKLKEYIDALTADSKGALKTLQAMPMAPVGSSPANFGAGPGPMMPGPFGQYMPMGPMTGSSPMFPMPFGGPGPFTPAPFGGPMMPMPPFPMPGAFGAPTFGGPAFGGPMPPMGGAMAPEQFKIMTDAQRDVTNTMLETNRKTQESYDRTNKMMADYLKS